MPQPPQLQPKLGSELCFVSSLCSENIQLGDIKNSDDDIDETALPDEVVVREDRQPNNSVRSLHALSVCSTITTDSSASELIIGDIDDDDVRTVSRQTSDSSDVFSSEDKGEEDGCLRREPSSRPR